ncbi:response regulator transcription factor [Paraburkholderia sp. SUR17]|uniref:response regulator transcription factor n=1 Tax=Paraburkholderia sp. SUR17 TaxID=3034358 RepID=UPI002407B294|nr:response regulator transcription factor [Paraburkholderia sp. SUR17]WEY40752.1 response regulator transcription factor [Paraburkholderia sp. SUR17]
MKLAVMTRSTALFRLICQCFEADGATCSQFADDVTLARAVYREDFSAILIDADTGVNPLRPVLARRACYADRRAPLIVVGARSDRASIARTFDAGADDVVLSPIDSRELVLRVHLALRRFQPVQPSDADDRLECGVYRLDRRSCVVHVAGDTVRLTSREFATAWLLFSRPGEYVSRRQIAGAVWSSSEDIVGRTLEQHIYKLRKKLELNGAHGVHLRTMYAHGYRIELAETAVAECEDEAHELNGTGAARHNEATRDTAREPENVMRTATPRHVAVLAAVVQRKEAAAVTSAAPADPAESLVLEEALRPQVHPAGSAAALDARPWSDTDSDAYVPPAASLTACAQTAARVVRTPWAGTTHTPHTPHTPRTPRSSRN